MKVSFPLSLKILLWLGLNLLLLVSAAAGFLIAQGGISFDSMVRGPTGAGYQELAHAIARACESAPNAAARANILKSYSATHGVEFFIFHEDLVRETDPESVLPPAIVPRIRERPPVRPGPGRGPRGFGPPSEGPPPRGGPGPEGPSRGGPRAEDEARGRFVVRAGQPAVYWAGARGNWGDFRPDRPAPAVIIARADTWWSVIRLLNLQSWFFAAGGVLVVSILFWLPLISSITRALRRLTQATEAIAEGRFETRVPDARRDELGHLGSSVNRMAARLDTLVNGQKRFLGDIAHELGSPLGRLQVATEILETRADPALREHVADVREEVQQMATLINELLAFTKAGLRPRDAELNNVPLAPLVQETLAREHAGTRVTAAVSADLIARADAALLGRAVANLVRNALRYTAPTDEIRVVATRDGANLHLAVEDDGPGVPAESLARLGEPFYRPDAARTREAGGTGLGLAIVVSSVAACGGEVKFSNRTPRGFRAAIRLASA